MAANLEASEIRDNLLWDAFVAESPQGNVFSTSAWMGAAAGAQGGIPRICGVFENGRLMAGASFLELARGPFRKATIAPLAPYCGFLFAPFSGTRPSEEESRNAALAEALIRCLLSRYHHVLLVQDPRYQDMREFLQKNFACRVRYSYILDITDIDRLRERMEPRVRSVIRKAESSLTVSGVIGLDEFGGLYERVYRDRGNHCPIPRAYVERLSGDLISAGIAEMRAVRDQSGALIAAHVVVFDRDTVYGLTNGAVPDRSSSGAFSLLLWDTIQRHRVTRKRYDLTGANLPSIAFFKKGFGGALAPYFVTERYSSPLVRAAFSLYTGIHKVLP
ncbi:MAG TPA: GNAT family N-acetyltransferase [Armatimonadota bacterium]|nr:GNAT family N-acetyltransferase [Armatimonadota bacterium]